MRCTRARQWMAAAADGELSPRRRRAFEGHLAGCGECRREQDATTRVLTAVGRLPGDATVSARLEQDTLRRVRLEASEEEERTASGAWWGALRLPALAAAGVAAVALVVGVLRDPGRELPVAPGPAVEQVARVPAGQERARPAAPTRPAVAEEAEAVTPPPGDPPPELAARPDLFMELPILRNMEKLENFEAIEMTTLDGAPHAPEGTRERSSG